MGRRMRDEKKIRREKGNERRDEGGRKGRKEEGKDGGGKV